MGLLDRIKKENKLKEFIINEFNILDKNIIENSIHKKKINDLKNLYRKNTFLRLERIKNELSNKILIKYEIDKTSHSKSKILNEHILFEKECIPLIKNFNNKLNQKNNLKKMKNEIEKRNKEHSILGILGYIISPIIFFKYIFSFIAHYDEVDAFSSTVMIIVFIFTGSGTIVGFLLIRDYISIGKFDKKIAEIDSLINALDKEIDKY